MNRSFPLSSPPNHTPLYLLPLAHGPTISYIGWVQAGGAWALRVLPFQILFKSLPAAYVSAATWRLPVCVSWPFMRAFFFAPFRSWASYDNGLYISLAHFWFSSLPATLICYSCRNDLILLDPFFGPAVYLFSVACHRHCFVFTHGLLCPFGLPFGHPRPDCFSLGFLGLFANFTLSWAFY